MHLCISSTYIINRDKSNILENKNHSLSIKYLSIFLFLQIELVNSFTLFYDIKMFSSYTVITELHQRFDEYLPVLSITHYDKEDCESFCDI